MMSAIRLGRRSRRGQALVPVLFVVLILTAVAATITSAARQEARAAGNYLRQTQQYFAAHGAIVFAAANLQQSSNGGATAPTLTPPPDTDANGWTQLGDAWYKVDIIDTGSRLNINTADIASIAKLPALQNNGDIAAAIIDWRTSTGVPYSGPIGTGAESDYYQTLNPSYSAKNAPFDTVDELLLVKGMTPQILYGSPNQDNSAANPNQVTTSTTQSTRSRQTGGSGGTGPTGGQANNQAATPVDTSQSTIPMSELITTYSRERNVSANGTPRVNVSTASVQQLTAIGIPRNVATIIQSGGYTSMSQLVTNSSLNMLQQFADSLTFNSGQYNNGLININTAPAEVLATVPGMDATLYNAIIQARQSGTAFNSLNDFFQLKAVTNRELAAIVNSICTKSNVYLVRVRVRVPGSDSMYAAEALVDLAVDPSSTSATGAGASSTSPTAQTSLAATTAAANTQTPSPTILQWREVGRYPGWSNWLPPPTYTNTSTATTGTSNTTPSIGGTLGNP